MEVGTAPWVCAQTVSPIRCPPLTESPFAHRRRYLRQGGVQRHLGEHYPPFIAHMDSCAPPNSSR